MPSWLQRQLQEAYHHGDIKRVRLLNECWLYYIQNKSSSSSKML